jgi:hypothetical protein
VNQVFCLNFVICFCCRKRKPPATQLIVFISCQYFCSHARQGCQMVLFLTKHPKLGKFWRVLQWTMLVYVTAIWYILWPFGLFYGHLVHFFSCGNVMYTKKNLYLYMTILSILRLFEIFLVIWYIFSRFGML